MFGRILLEIIGGTKRDKTGQCPDLYRDKTGQHPIGVSRLSRLTGLPEEKEK